MRECGTPNVPKYTQLRNLQKKLDSIFGLSPKPHVSSLGNNFHMSHPAQLLALDWGNPFVRKHLRLYPEVSEVISETWQAEKWLKEVDPNELSPMWADWSSAANRHRHFYVQELAQTHDGQLFIPIRWVTVKGIVHADAHSADIINGSLVINSELVSRIPAASLKHNALDLTSLFQFKLPLNPIRAIAKGRPVFRLRVIPWSDDVSGNRSKQYNAHTNVYVTNASLPHIKLCQEYFVRFCSTSTFASSSEQFVALQEDFQEDRWHEAYDCELEEEILFQIVPHYLPADNPQQSETASHIGGKGNQFCRRDMAGGSEVMRESNAGYGALYSVGEPRTCQETVGAIRDQLKLACRGNSDAVRDLATATGIKDKIAQHWIGILLEMSNDLLHKQTKDVTTRDSRLNSTLSKETRKGIVEEIKDIIAGELWEWLVTQPVNSIAHLPDNHSSRFDIRPGDHYNVLLATRGIDPHKDTPVEILHTWLLGAKKYVWYETSRLWAKDSEEEKLFAARLQSSWTDGLSIPPIRAQYLVKYKNNLIGKHLKVLQQLGIFHIHGICSPAWFNVWKASGELGAMLWHTEIHDMDVYLADLQVLIDNLLDTWAIVDPCRIMKKVKLHVLTHLPDDIRRFGLAVAFSTEVFECYNAVFRYCSILSNHLAPSRDIAVTIAGMERFKHMVSGGYWKNGQSGEYIQAGSRVRNFLKTNQELQRRLGWVNEETVQAGHVKRVPRNKRQPSTWHKALEALGLVGSESVTQVLKSRGTDVTWERCAFAVSRSKDICREGSWIFYKHGSETIAGRINAILSPEKAMPESALVIVTHFDILGSRDTYFGMPVLVRTNNHHCLSPKEILFGFNAQHDCVMGKCTVQISAKPVIQERVETLTYQKEIAHLDDDRFLLNMHALHNAHLIRLTLPRQLTAPVKLRELRTHFHLDRAAEAQKLGAAKRAETNAKGAATREKNKQAKLAAEALVQAECGTWNHQ